MQLSEGSGSYPNPERPFHAPFTPPQSLNYALSEYPEGSATATTVIVNELMIEALSCYREPRRSFADMFKNPLVVGCCLGLTASCTSGDGAGGDYRRAALVSSKGDTLYVKSYRWGLTGDKQLSTVADTDAPIGLEDRGKPGIVEGLDPFRYHFAHDTLTLCARAPLPAFALRGPSPVVQYRVVDNPRYMALYQPLGNTAFHRVPE